MPTPVNYWGRFDDLQTPRTPVSLLKWQANLLGDATEGILRGAVENVSGGGRFFEYDLNVVAPALNDYSYTVLRIAHEIDFYPLKIFRGVLTQIQECADEDDFLVALRDILSSPRVRSVIENLIAQSKS